MRERILRKEDEDSLEMEMLRKRILRKVYVDLEDESIEYGPDYLWLIHYKYMQCTELCGHNNLLLWHHSHL